MVIKEAVEQGISCLEEAGIEDAKTDAFLFLEAAAGISRAQYLMDPERSLSGEETELFRSWIDRRAKHEPLQYILGRTEFYGLPFRVNENVLIPRQDTELLVEEALKRIPSGGKLLDLCTGSGAVAVAIKHEREDAVVTALDISPNAIETAKENAKENHCGIEFLISDLYEKLAAEHQYDVIVSNPPYITDSEYETLMPEVKEHEPSLALLAGPEGLDIYKRLVKEAPKYLKANGKLLLEIGCGQAGAVSSLLKEAGFTRVQVFKDLAGLDRVVAGEL